MLSGQKLSRAGKERADWPGVALLVPISMELLDRHPYDLSGGEQQRAALAKVLLLRAGDPAAGRANQGAGRGI